MNILKLLQEHNKNINSINNNINNLLLMEKWYDPTTWFDKEPVKTQDSQEDQITDPDLLGAIESGQKILDIASSMSKTPIDTSKSKNTNILSIKFKLMDDIKLEEPHDKKIIKKGDSLSFNILKIIPESNKTIIIIDGEYNKLIPNDIQLKITIPFPDGLNYKNDFNANVEQKNKETGETEELNDIKLKILSHT